MTAERDPLKFCEMKRMWRLIHHAAYDDLPWWVPFKRRILRIVRRWFEAGWRFAMYHQHIPARVDSADPPQKPKAPPNILIREGSTKGRPAP